MPRMILKEIEKIRTERFLSLSTTVGGKTKLEHPPSTSASGFYWLYTNYPLKELKNVTKTNYIKGAVDMGELARLHIGLKHVCKIKREGYLLVYNGIGGIGPKGSGGLRERILQEFSGGQGTGSLAIKKSTLSDLSRWKYSYVTVSGSSEVDIVCNYVKWAKKLEMMWRLQYGWSVFCKK